MRTLTVLLNHIIWLGNAHLPEAKCLFSPIPIIMKKILLFTALSFLTALAGATACSRNLEQNDPKTPSQTSQTNNASATSQEENNMNILDKTSIDERCLHAVEDLEWNNVDIDQALKTCQMFHTFLIKQYEIYDKMMLIEKPVPPYYFMQAFVEREINPIYVVHAQDGVIPKNNTDAIQAFVKHIDILNTTMRANKLAYMIYGFHAGDTEDLATSHKDADSRPEINAPTFIKNADGSATLTYDLINTGRSTTVRQCILTVGADYQTALNCTIKQ